MTTLAETKRLNEALAATIRPQSDLQQEALEEFLKTGLPHSKNEEYKHTPIARVLEKNFNPNLPFATVGKMPDENLWRIHAAGAYTVVFLNGNFQAKHSFLPEAFNVRPLAQALQNQPSLGEHIGRYAGFRGDAFAAWNTAAWTDGVCIEIPDGYSAEKPLYIYYLHDTSSGQVLAVTRNLVLAGRNSRATVVEKWFTAGARPVITNTLSEVVLQEQAMLNHLVIQTDPGNHIQHLINQFHQQSASVLNSYVITLNSTFTRNNTRVTLDGACTSHLYGLYLLENNMFADNHTVVDHRQPNALSNELYKGVLGGQANGVFNGKIYVRPGAQKTNAFQSNRNLLLSEQALMHTKPQLEIWADDVKCSHGCTVGQIDENALFYLRARGIDTTTAKAMLLYAFAAEVTETLPDEQLRTYLNELIGNRLHNQT